jgi:hypothetical protein
MPNRPTAVLVIAIIHLTLGGLGLFCGVGVQVMRVTGLGKALASAAPQNREQQARTEANEQIKAAKLPGYRFYTSFSSVMSLVLSAALVAGGLGLLWLKPWGHWLSTGYGVASILTELVVLLYGILYLNPLEMELLRNNPPPPGVNQQQVDLIAGIAGTVGSAMPCCFMIYPIAVLVVMFLPSTLAAFSGGRPPPGTDDD